jgi:hypothetical protein
MQARGTSAIVPQPAVAAGVARGINSNADPITRGETLNVQSSTELLDLVEQAETVSLDGKGAVKTARASRAAKAQQRERQRERRAAVVTLPSRNAARTIDRDQEAASAARDAVDRVRRPAGGLRIGAPE